MKRVLFVAYYFPPAGGSAVQRLLKFVKYLPEFGWEPVVLTAREGDAMLSDPSLLNEIPPGVRVVRAAAPDLYGLFAKLKKGKSSDVDMASLSSNEGKGSLLSRLALAVRGVLFIPDARVGWKPFAVAAGRHLLRSQRFDAIFTSSPPFTTAWIGAALTKRSRLPWVSDYRDPWTDAYFYTPRPRLSAAIERRLERKLLHRASRVTTISQRLLAGLASRQAWDVERFGRVIPNGFDPQDFEGLQPRQFDRCTVVYTGTVNAKMHPGPLLEAARRLLTRDPQAAQDLRLLFIGRIDASLQAMFSAPDLASMVQIEEHQPHQQCLEATAGADLLLLLIPNAASSPLILTGKLFEYLRSGRPVLCLSDSGDAADLVREAKAGFVHPPTDVDGLTDLLSRLLDRWRRGMPLSDQTPDASVVARYNRREHAGQLARVLDEAVAE